MEYYLINKRMAESLFDIVLPTPVILLKKFGISQPSIESNICNIFYTPRGKAPLPSFIRSHQYQYQYTNIPSYNIPIRL